MDQIIEGTAFINNRLAKCCIGITDGIITQIKNNLDGAPKKTFSDKNIILPSGIDIHVHFRDPGFPDKEDFYFGTRAAAYGGITCICDMPNSKPFTGTVAHIKEKNQIAQAKSIIDYGLFAGITTNNSQVFHRLNRYACGFKLYLSETTGSEGCDPAIIPEVFHSMANISSVLLVHAEDPRYFKKDPCVNNLDDHFNARPIICETQAVKDLLKLQQMQDIALHFCHISSKEALTLLQKRSKKVTVGVTPHHVFLHKNLCIRQPTFFKVNPPLRAAEAQSFLLNAVNDKMIDIFESDHAPHTFSEKSQSLSVAPSGVPGVETMYPLLLAAVKRGQFALSRVIDLICRNPAKLLRIPKGVIAIGYHADLCIFDLNNIVEISAKALHTKCGWSPFEGWHGIFPSDVMSRGTMIISDNEFIGNKGFGKNITTFCK
ncbi:MAG: dihydroorotase [Candidatus Thermoplasmatota archaeon]|nr:dihydroorotase [Candidatus Thermoplasmatota archaeon]MBU1940360.1 dihydroorotase [Candidatus Thermoplasmatota archaeon]